MKITKKQPLRPRGRSDEKRQSTSTSNLSLLKITPPAWPGGSACADIDQLRLKNVYTVWYLRRVGTCYP